MENPAPQKDSEKPQSICITTTLQILERIENWLASIFEVTDEEQKNAGIYFDDRRHK